MVDFDDETGEGEYLVACRKHMATTEQDLFTLEEARNIARNCKTNRRSLRAVGQNRRKLSRYLCCADDSWRGGCVSKPARALPKNAYGLGWAANQPSYGARKHTTAAVWHRSREPVSTPPASQVRARAGRSSPYTVCM
jgi:hypothetical protein